MAFSSGTAKRVPLAKWQIASLIGTVAVATGVTGTMAEQHLNAAHVRTGFQHVGGEYVAQPMRVNVLRDSSLPNRWSVSGQILKSSCSVSSFPPAFTD